MDSRIETALWVVGVAAGFTAGWFVGRYMLVNDIVDQAEEMTDEVAKALASGATHAPTPPAPGIGVPEAAPTQEAAPAPAQGQEPTPLPVVREKLVMMVGKLIQRFNDANVVFETRAGGSSVLYYQKAGKGRAHDTLTFQTTDWAITVDALGQLVVDETTYGEDRETVIRAAYVLADDFLNTVEEASQGAPFAVDVEPPTDQALGRALKEVLVGKDGLLPYPPQA